MSCKLFFAGDIVLADGCFKMKLFSDDILQEINTSDLVCCNFEAPISEGLKSQKKIGPNNSNSNKIPEILANNGFNLITLANNHIFDFGIEGIKKTCDIFKNLNLNVIGAGTSKEDIYKPYIRDINGCKIGVINMAENGFGAAIENDEYGFAYIFHDKITENVKKLRESCDIIIAICHAGAEHWDIPLPEWRKAYRELSDLGVDIIIAHHPHVQQGWEKYNNSMIFYSLGNFAFDKGKGVQDAEAYAVIVSIDDNKLFKCDVIPTIFEDGIIKKDKNENRMEYLLKCCSILEDDSIYIDKINNMCIEKYESYKEVYARVVCKYSGNLKEIAKGIIKRYILNEKFQDTWLYHNIVIESHYYICKRATRLKLKKDKIL